LPPALSAKDFAGRRTEVLNVYRIRTIKCHPSDCDVDSAPESISDTDNGLNWKGDLDNRNESKDDCDADNESDIEPCSDINASESPEGCIVCATLNVPRLIQPTQKSMNQAEK